MLCCGHLVLRNMTLERISLLRVCIGVITTREGKLIILELYLRFIMPLDKRVTIGILLISSTGLGKM